MATRLVALAGTVLLAGAAHAQPAATGEPALAPPGSVGPEPPDPAPTTVPRVHVGIHGSLRFTGLDGHAARARDQLDGYGWPSTQSPVLVGLGADAEYLRAPLLDVGVAWSWSRGTHAAGLDATTDQVRTDVVQVGAVGRLHGSRGRPFIPEPRVEVGLMRVRTELHGVADARTVTYLRAGVDWRVGTRRGGAQVAVGYTMTGRAADGELDLATGGLDVGIGPYLRF